MNMAHEPKSNKNILHLVGEMIGIPNIVMDVAIHDLKERISVDPKYKGIKEWLDTLPKINSPSLD